MWPKKLNYHTRNNYVFDGFRRSTVASPLPSRHELSPMFDRQEENLGNRRKKPETPWNKLYLQPEDLHL